MQLKNKSAFSTTPLILFYLSLSPSALSSTSFCSSFIPSSLQSGAVAAACHALLISSWKMKIGGGAQSGCGQLSVGQNTHTDTHTQRKKWEETVCEPSYERNCRWTFAPCHIEIFNFRHKLSFWERRTLYLCLYTRWKDDISQQLWKCIFVSKGDSPVATFVTCIDILVFFVVTYFFKQ